PLRPASDLGSRFQPSKGKNRSQGMEARRSFRGQDHARWEADWPDERGRYEEDPWEPSRPRGQVEEPDPSWYKPYDPATDGRMEDPYFRRYDDRRVPYYDVNLGQEALFFDGRDVTGFMEKWESYAYRKRFSERKWIDYFTQHSDPELDTAIRAIYPSDGRWRTFRASLLQTFACDDLIPTVEGLRRITRGERESLVAFIRRFKRLSQALVDRGMLSEVDRCVMFMLHLPEEKRKEVLEKAPRDSANFEKVAEVVFTGGGVDVREYMKETLDMALRNMRGTRNDGPRGNDKPPPCPPIPRWGERPTGWRNESSGQGGWRNDREMGGNRGSDWGSFHWKDARDERWGDAPQARAPGLRPECTLLEYLAASKSAMEELLSITRKVRVPIIGGPTVPVEAQAKEGVQTSRITLEELPANFFSGEETKKFYVLGSGQLQAVVSGKKMRALVDNGSKSTVCRDSIARELGLEIDRGVAMSMVVSDNKLQPAKGVCHSPMIEVAGVEVTVPIFSVKECSSKLILGRTWLSAVHATTVDLPDGSQTLSIQSPDGIRVVLKTVDAQDERNRTSLTKRKGAQSRERRVRLEEVPLTDRGPKGDQLEIEDVGDRIVINGMGYEKEDEEEEFGGFQFVFFGGIPLAGGVKKHKTVAEKVKPAAVSRDRTGEVTMSEEEIADIIRTRKETEGQRITANRLAKMDIGDGNLTEEEKEFIAMTLRGCDKAIAFDDSERGRIDPRYVKPARIHTVPHVPWKDRPQWKYAQKEKEEIVAFIKEKIRTFVAEPCESAYSNEWFFLRKGGSNKLRWIQNLQRTNAVTVRDVGSIPEADLLAEGSAGRSIYSICDLFSGYDEILLDYRDRHMTVMHTPLGLVQMMVVPMGWTNGVAVFQRAMIEILKEFIPKKVEVFQDDFPIKGPVERDETEVFPGVRKFVADQMKDVRDILEKPDDANLTVSGTKSRRGVSSIKILGFICDKEGRRPDPEKLVRLMTWPSPLKSVTEVRQFLGVVGY
ncbi:hypothetical protein CBR_g41078, partial [Chara braunii]